MSMSRSAMWAAIHRERARLAEDRAALDEEQWQRPTLCGAWTVRDVVAHLTAVASTGRIRRMTSVIGARVDFDLHNQRRLTEQLGDSPGETLDRFRRVITSTTAASGHTPAWLGEVLVHAQDIRRPPGLTSTPAVDAAVEVADFFVRRDFTVPSKTNAHGLRLEATDSHFAAGAGPCVRGTTLDLTMAVAGRSTYCDDLSGPGVSTLRNRTETTSQKS